MDTTVKTSGRLLKDVFNDVRAILDTEGLIGDYFTMPTKLLYGEAKTRTWPDRYSWISCFAVTGGSEGHYVEVITDNTRELIFLGKTFDGWDAAWNTAKRVAALLEA